MFSIEMLGWDLHDFGHESGRRGSEWAETLGKWSWKVREGYGIPPGALGQHKKIKNGQKSENRKMHTYIYIYIPINRSGGLYVTHMQDPAIEGRPVQNEPMMPRAWPVWQHPHAAQTCLARTLEFHALQQEA